MTVLELYQKLSERIPKELSCQWDNDGLMCCPQENKQVKKVMVVLDVTEQIVKKAIADGYDVILSHHPLVFKKLSAVEPQIPVAKKVITLLTSGISVMSFHTRLDAVEGGVNDTLANALGLCQVTPFANGIGRVGRLSKAMPLKAFADRIKSVTGVEKLLLSDAGRDVQTVAILGGSGSDDVAAAIESGADTYLSGELAHHYLADAPELGINLIAAGHFHTENPVCKTLAKWVSDIDEKITVAVENSNAIEIY